MRKLFILLSISISTLLLTGCELSQELENSGKTDFEILYDYAQSNGEFGSDEDGNYYHYVFPDYNYGMWVYQNGNIDLIYLDEGTIIKLYVIIQYFYGELDDGFMLIYSYESDDFDDFGYDDDALYLRSLGELIVIFDYYDGTTKEYDEELAAENGLDLINYVSRYFRNQIGVDLK